MFDLIVLYVFLFFLICSKHLKQIAKKVSAINVYDFCLSLYVNATSNTQHSFSNLILDIHYYFVNNSA